MEFKDFLPLIGVAVTLFIFSWNLRLQRKKEFAELLLAMDRDKQTEIKKIEKENEKAIEIKKEFDKQDHEIREQAHEILYIKNEFRGTQLAHEEMKSDIKDIKVFMGKISQQIALLDQRTKKAA